MLYWKKADMRVNIKYQIEKNDFIKLLYPEYLKKMKVRKEKRKNESF